MPLVTARHQSESLWRVERHCFDPLLADRLRDEANRTRASATIRDFVEPHITAEGRLYSQTRHWVGEPGPELEALHDSDWLSELVAGFARKPVLATRGAYIYYDIGGSVGLHTDVGACTASALIPIAHPAPEALVVHPELVGLDAASLLDISARHAGHPPAGVTLEYPSDGLVLLQGNSLPHHRPPCAEPVTIAALCFDSLL